MFNQDYFKIMIEKLEPFLQMSNYEEDTIVYTAITDEGKEYLLVTDLNNNPESISLVEQHEGYEIKLTVATKERTC